MLRLDFSKELNWYNGVEFEDSHLVTSENYNKALGITGIILSPPATHGSNGRVLAGVTIMFENKLTLNGTVYANKKGTGLTFGVEQTKYDRADGSVGYADINVNVPTAIQAQVLRWATTKAKDVPVTKKAPVQEYKEPTQSTIDPFNVVEDQPPVVSAFAKYDAMDKNSALVAMSTDGFSPEIIVPYLQARV